jgi:hypothetical protein
MATPSKLCQHDLCHLILRFFLAIKEGQPNSLSTFKQTWKELHFSWIFHVMPRSFTFDRYVQLLYSIILDALVSGFPRHVVHDLTVETRRNELLSNEEEDNDQRPGPSNRAHSNIEDEPIAPELQHLLFEELPPALLSPRQQQQQPPLPAIPEEEEEDWLQESDHPILDLLKPNLNLEIASLFALLCLFHAQPSQNFPSVKIYLSKEHQAAFLNMLPNLSAAAATSSVEQQHKCLEAQSVAKYLLDNAFVLGGGSSAQTTTPSSARLKSPGTSTSPFLNPQAAEEAAIVREVKFQLSSALKGLGAKFLPPMYDDYREKLERVWKVTAPPGGDGGGGEPLSLEKGGNVPPQPQPQPQPISDLSLGKLLNQYVEYKEAEVQYLLAHGKKWRIRKLARGIPKSAGKMETEAVKSLSTGVFKSQHQLQRIIEEEEETTTTTTTGRKEVQAEQTEGEEVGKQQQADFGGLPPSARRAMELEVKRKQEIKKRAKAWTDRMGIDATNLAASGGGSFEDAAALQHGDEDSLMEDMPTDLPGLHDWIPPSATAATLSMYDYEEEGEDRGGRDATPPGAVAAERNAGGGGGGMSTGGEITEATVEQQLEGEEDLTLHTKQGRSKGKGKRSSSIKSSETSKKAKKLKTVDTKKLESVLAEQAEIVKRTLAQAQTEAEDYDD